MLAQIINWIFAGITALAGILYIEEWYRHKYKTEKAIKEGESVVIATSVQPQSKANRLQSIAASFMVISMIGFVISGSVWLTEIQNNVNYLFTGNGGVQITGYILSAGPIREGPVPTNNFSTTNLYNGMDITLGGSPSGQLSRGYSEGIGFIVAARIENPGETTTAWEWTAKIIFPDGTEAPGIIPSGTIPTNSIQYLQTLNGPMRLQGSEYLINELAFTPLESGASINGWVYIHFNGVKDIPPGSTIIIQYRDVRRHYHTIQDTWVPGT